MKPALLLLSLALLTAMPSRICMAASVKNPAGSRPVENDNSPRGRAVALLREATPMVSQFPAPERSPALNSLAAAWKPIAPATAHKYVVESFAAASHAGSDRQAEQQAEVIRLAASTDLPTAERLIGMIAAPPAAEYTTDTDPRSAAWDALLDETLARYGVQRALEETRKMTSGLADSVALSTLTSRLLEQSPDQARELLGSAVQQFGVRPITARRFVTLPNALVALSTVDAPTARRLCASLFAFLPQPAVGSEAATSAGKARNQFLSRASHSLLKKATLIDPVLAQEWSARLTSGQSTTGPTAKTAEPNAGIVPDSAVQDAAADQDPRSLSTENAGSSSEGVADSSSDLLTRLNAIKDPAARAKVMLRLSQKYARRDPGLSGELLGAARAQVASISDPSQRASLYAGAARTEERLGDPRAGEDLGAAAASLEAAWRSTDDPAARNSISIAEMRIMKLLMQKLEAESAENQARGFQSPEVRFNALIIAASKWWAMQPDLNNSSATGVKQVNRSSVGAQRAVGP